MSPSPQGWWYALESASDVVTPERMRRFAWIALGCMLAMAILSLLHLGAQELSQRRHLAIQVDELYFAACAARGTAVGEYLVSGCHDSKAPVIFLLYQWLQAGDRPYDLVAVTAAALTTIAAIVALVAWLAFRVAGSVAAVAAPALLIEALSDDASVLAFKTDTVGAVFMLVGLLLLMDGAAARKALKLFAAGLFFGLSVVTKQSYGFIALGVMAWLAMPALGPRKHASLAPALLDMLRRAALFGAGVALPFALFLVLFKATQRDDDFLASFFLYPSIYSESPLHSAKAMFWRISDVLDILSRSPFLIVLSLFAAFGVAFAALRGRGSSTRASLVLFSAAAAGSILLIAPTYYTYHTIPLWILAAILGGTAVSELWSRFHACTPAVTVGVACSLLIAATLSAASTWHTNGGRRTAPQLRDETPVVAGGGYAYVLGTWPDFYVYNGLVPASDIMFPWALPGTPASWVYHPPKAGSLRGHMLNQMHARNLPKLYDDFSRTPPRYIVVVDDMARSPGSTRIADVQGFDEYLDRRCTFVKAVQDERRGSARLFQCHKDAAGGSAP